MEAGLFIVPDLVSPCQLDPVRFTPVHVERSSRVTDFAPGFSLSEIFVQEVDLPVGSYNCGAFGVGFLSGAAVPAAPSNGVRRSALVVHRTAADLRSLSTGGFPEAVAMIVRACPLVSVHRSVVVGGR